MKTVRVNHDPSTTPPSVLVSALNGAGLQATLGKRVKPADSYSVVLPVHVILSGLLIAVSCCSWISPSVEWMKYLTLVAVAVGCRVIIRRALASLRQLVLDINTLMIVAVTGAIALLEFYEAASIIFLFSLAEWLEDRSLEKARNALAVMHEAKPEYSISAETGQPLAVGDIQIGDALIIRPGDHISVDGTVISGSSAVNESLLTGESLPIKKKTGDRILSGSMNSGKSSLTIQALSSVGDSTVAQLEKRVEAALEQKSDSERTVEAFAKIYTPVILILAILMALLPLMFNHLIWRKWLKKALVVLVTACPCAFVISTPVTIVCGIARASQKMILIKGGRVLEALSQLRVVTFDKTGTLTKGHFDVVATRTVNGVSEEELLKRASSLEIHSSHPLSNAIIGMSAAKGCCAKDIATLVEDIPGYGIVGVSEGVTIGVGNAKLMRRQIHDGDTSFVEEMQSEFEVDSQKLSFLSMNERVVGVIVAADQIRDSAKSAVEELQSMKLETCLLTGDSPTAAHFVAMTVGIDADKVHAALLPEDKKSLLEYYRQQHGPVGHVGDGLNDALALASADVGIAMGVGGSTMAIDAADVALFSNEISSIPTAVKIAQMAKRIIQQNIGLAIAVKAAVVSLAFVSEIGLWQAVIADVGISLLVIINGLRLLGYDRKWNTKHRHHCKFWQKQPTGTCHSSCCKVSGDSHFIEEPPPVICHLAGSTSESCFIDVHGISS